jgi:LacI family transcriptional regulator
MPVRKTYVTLTDIARVARVHTSTASLALRNDPRLRLSTCRRVQGVARRLGYVPDPLVASLSSFRRTMRPLRYRATLAWVTNYLTSDGWRDRPIVEEFHAAAVEVARSAGYKLEEFWLRPPGMNGVRATAILRSRGITGLLVAPQPDLPPPLAIDWSKFSCVAFGSTVRHAALHVACNHQFRSMELAIRQMTKRGYRRIGFVVLRAFHDRVDHNWMAGYLATLPPARRLPPLVLPKWDPAAIAAWTRRHRPDGIITRHPELLDTLARLNRKVPEDIGVAFMNVTDRSGWMAGIYEDGGRIGRGAVEWLIDLVRRNECGIPEVPQRLMFDGVWVEGKTVR